MFSRWSPYSMYYLSHDQIWLIFPILPFSFISLHHTWLHRYIHSDSMLTAIPNTTFSNGDISKCRNLLILWQILVRHNHVIELWHSTMKQRDGWTPQQDSFTISSSSIPKTLLWHTMFTESLSSCRRTIDNLTPRISGESFLNIIWLHSCQPPCQEVKNLLLISSKCVGRIMVNNAACCFFCPPASHVVFFLHDHSEVTNHLLR